MDEAYTDNKEMTISEIFKVSFKILKGNWLTYIIAVLIIALLISALGMFQFLFEGNVIVESIMTLLNGLGAAAVSVIYIVTTYNAMRQDQKNVDEQIFSKILRILLTQILLGLIILIPCLILIFAFVQLLVHTGSYSYGVYGFTRLMMLILVIPTGIWLSLKCSFMTQSIVLDDVYYMSAIKRTFTKTSGRTMKILGIKSIQLLLGVVGYMMGSSRLFGASKTTFVLLIVLGIIGAVLAVLVSIGITVVYVSEVMIAETDDMTYSLEGEF